MIRFLRPSLWTASLLLAAGCGPGHDYARFIPPEASARRTLQVALQAWCDHGVPGPVPSVSPAIELVDSQHRPAQNLTAFEVLGPTPGDADRCYAVRLSFQGPPEEVRARYVVFGQDPLWVMRYEDYEMVMHWCNPPTSSPPAAAKPSS